MHSSALLAYIVGGQTSWLLRIWNLSQWLKNDSKSLILRTLRANLPNPTSVNLTDLSTFHFQRKQKFIWDIYVDFEPLCICNVQWYISRCTWAEIKHPSIQCSHDSKTEKATEDTLSKLLSLCTLGCNESIFEGGRYHMVLVIPLEEQRSVAASCYILIKVLQSAIRHLDCPTSYLKRLLKILAKKISTEFAIVIQVWTKNTVHWVHIYLKMQRGERDDVDIKLELLLKWGRNFF